MAVTVRITLRRVLAVAAAMLAIGLAVAWSGVIHVGASTGHAAITDWFLHWAMRNTVRTYSALTVEAPAIDPTGLVSAAGHYASSCAPCHGAPGEQASPQMQAATPHAPDLAATAPTYSDAELFWIVKHGVKFTGMPAWPSLDRDDEIRRMAAFVRRLPDMEAREYRALAYGPAGTVAGARATAFDAALAECERCHAEHGRDQSDIPVLAGQKSGYLLRALEAFASGGRDSGVMQSAAVRVDEELRRRLAEHYAARRGLVEKPIVDPSIVSEPSAGGDAVTSGRATSRRGGGATPAALSAAAATSVPEVGARRSLAAEAAAATATPASVVAGGIPALDVPACANCHSPGKREDYPILAGQKADYLAGRLRNWRRHEREVEARLPDEPMPMIARRIPERLIEPLARYFSEL